MAHFQEVISFWFDSKTKKNWFSKDSAFDDLLRTKFLETYQQGSQGELSNWRSEPLGRLAEVVVLDQFPRNMFRDKAQAFVTDSLALILSQEAIRGGADKDFDAIQKAFLYMPFMHSESRLIHNEALKLFSKPGLEYNLEYELAHRKIIEKFGRYPHRNKILGRISTAEEIAFLKTPHSSF